MRKFPLLLLLSILLPTLLSGCDDDTTQTLETYREWILENNKWLADKAAEVDENGDPIYTKVVPDYDQSRYVLIRWFNDRVATQKNLSPYWTSTVDVKYYGELCDGTPFDSSYLSTDPADSIFRTSLSSVIDGWSIALQQMHVGDTCEVIIPYPSAYGSTGSTSIPSYSNLKFGIKLVDIPYYEISD